MPKGKRGLSSRAIAQRKGVLGEAGAQGGGSRHERARTAARDDEQLRVHLQKGATPRQRHLVRDFARVLPNAQLGAKIDARATLDSVQDACYARDNGMAAVFLRAPFEDEMTLWLARVPDGPSARFHVVNLHTVAELNFQYTVRRVRQPCLLSFDGSFEGAPHLRLIKELLRGLFAGPGGQPGAGGRFSSVISFCHVDEQIWVRAYDLHAEGEGAGDDGELSLRERGPRLVLIPQSVITSVVRGATIWCREAGIH